MLTAGYAYVVRTSYIREIEDMAGVTLFVRPRRFGKSLWLRTLMTYYDVLTADRHEWGNARVTPTTSPGQPLAVAAVRFEPQTLTIAAQDFEKVTMYVDTAADTAPGTYEAAIDLGSGVFAIRIRFTVEPAG